MLDDLTGKGARGVGRFRVEFEVANNVDVVDAERGLLAPSKVRRAKISGALRGRKEGAGP